MEFLIGVVIIIILVMLVFNVIRNKQEKSIDTIQPTSKVVEKDNVTEATSPLVDELDTPWEIISYNKFDIQESRSPHSLALSNKLIDQIGNLMQVTNSANDLIRTDKKVIIKFTKEITEKLKSGEYNLMNVKASSDKVRALAVDGSNKIKGHGIIELKKIKQVNPAQLANVAFGVMTIVTSQEHLDRINQQLTSLDNKLDTLLRKHNNDKFGFINGSIKYYKSILPSIIDQDSFSTTYLMKVEDISAEAYKQLESVIRELNAILPRTSEFKNTKFKLDGNIDGIKELISNFEEQLLLAFGTLELLSISLKLTTHFGISKELSNNKLMDIEQYFKQLDSLQTNFKSSLLEKATELDARFRRTSTIESKKVSLFEQHAELVEVINSNKASTEQYIDEHKNGPLLSSESPVALQVEYDDYQKVIAVQRL